MLFHPNIYREFVATRCRGIALASRDVGGGRGGLECEMLCVCLCRLVVPEEELAEHADLVRAAPTPRRLATNLTALGGAKHKQSARARPRAG